jgi:hypothetical protein
MLSRSGLLSSGHNAKSCGSSSKRQLIIDAMVAQLRDHYGADAINIACHDYENAIEAGLWRETSLIRSAIDILSSQEAAEVSNAQAA